MSFIAGLYFDCKLDLTAVRNSEEKRNDMQSISHCSIVIHYPDNSHEQKQEGVYAGFVEPDSGKGTIVLIDISLHLQQTKQVSKTVVQLLSLFE